LHLDRVSRCPTDLPSGVEWATPPEPPRTARKKIVEKDDVYVIDRLIAHARAQDESSWLVKVRWAAFGPEDDTWEPAHSLPEDLLARYERRKKLPAGLLLEH
jgi:hypothetical protein